MLEVNIPMFEGLMYVVVRTLFTCGILGSESTQ